MTRSYLFISVYILAWRRCDLSSCVSDFFRFHAPTPALIVLQKSLKWINFSGSGCWIIAHVHVVCDYCSVTPDADPGLHTVPHVCEECGHVSSGRFLNFNMRHTFVFSLCCFLDHLWHHGIMQHHSKQLTSFLFLITSAFCVKTPLPLQPTSS